MASSGRLQLCIEYAWRGILNTANFFPNLR